MIKYLKPCFSHDQNRQKKEIGDPRTMRDALAAQVLGDIDTLLDKADAVAGAVNSSVAKMDETIRRLEGAGETYNQAVLAANMRSKKKWWLI